tara:strand:+ start:58 stop:360 length:303 start_codon:yes stop_codon:yes gene_type:complete
MSSYDESKMFLKKSDFTLDEWVLKMKACKFSKSYSIKYYNSDDEFTNKSLNNSQSIHLYSHEQNLIINDFMLMFFELNNQKQIKDLERAFEIVKRKKKSI